MTKAAMTWNIIEAWRASRKPVATFKPEPQVYRDHVEILRRIKAPDELIKLAEELADANSEPALKTGIR